MDCSPPSSFVHGISQARILKCVAIYISRGIFPSQWSNLCLLLARLILYHWATWEVEYSTVSLFQAHPGHLKASIKAAVIHLVLLRRDSWHRKWQGILFEEALFIFEAQDLNRDQRLQQPFRMQSRISLVVYWLTVHRLMHGTQVWSLIGEDYIWHGATKSMCHNYWSPSPKAGVSQQEKPP